MGTEQVWTAAGIHTGDTLLGPGWLAAGEGRILDLGAGPVPERHAQAPRQDLGPDLLVPGLVDIHCHGGGGASFSEASPADPADTADTAGTEDPDDDADHAILHGMIRAHRATGTTSLMASLVTAAPQELLSRLRRLRSAVEQGVLAGIHLEGPWLSPVQAGAHDRDLLRAPTAREVGQVLEAAGPALSMVTLAPELPGAPEAIRDLVGAGVVVAVGHTEATYAQAQAAVEAGATVATHLLNATRAPHHREPGAALALLEDERVWIESIADGAHLHPAVLRALSRAAGHRWVLVSDAIAAAGQGAGRFNLGGVPVLVQDGVARRADAAPGEGVLAGSARTLGETLPVALAAGVDLKAAVRAATWAPAQALGRPDAGRLAPGVPARMCRLTTGGAVREVWSPEPACPDSAPPPGQAYPGRTGSGRGPHCG